MTVSVASITTAFNAAHVLPRQMDALLRQTRPLQEIVVIDNGSRDTTRQLLEKGYPQVTVLGMPGNLGAAGAWSEGLAYAALKKRHDWIWAFDDDSVPDAGALEGLLQAIEPDSCGGKTGMIAMLPVHQETGISYPPLLWREGFHRPPAEMLGQPVWFTDLAIASGLLISRELVKEIGLPRSDFFMDFFDFEYCLRARSHGYKIAVVSSVQLNHSVGNAHHVRLPGFSALWSNHAPWREYYIIRNMIYMAWWLYPTAATKRFVLRHTARHACASLLFGSKKLACVRKMAQGFWDGRRARLGIRFLPS